jgi:hypothetical protein
MLSIVRLLKKVHRVRRDKTLRNSQKNVIMKKLELKFRRFDINLVRDVAAKESVKSDGLYKLFCQCVALTGRING